MTRRLIDFFFIYMIFEVIVRKLFLKEYSVEIKIFRDLIPGLTYAIYFLGRYRYSDIRWPDSLIGISLTLYIATGIMQFFNPESWGPLVGLLGLRTHFAYLPLLILAPAYIRTRDQLIRRLVCLCIIVVPVVIVGLIQNRLPASDPLNANSDAVFGDAGLVRASGTFSYITGYGVLCQFVLVAAMALLVLKPIRSRAGLIAVVGAVFAFVGCLSSGSRAPVVGSALQLGVFCTMLVWSRAGGRTASVLKIAILGAVVGAVAIMQAPDVYEAFRQRAMAAAFDVTGRLDSGIFGWWSVLAEYPLGMGIGMAHQQAGTLVGRTAGFLSGYESELSRIAYELGIPGFVAMAVFRLSLLSRIGFGARALTDPARAVVAALSFSTIALMLTGGVYTPMGNALLYLTAGLGLAAVNAKAAVLLQRPQRRALRRQPYPVG
ncbi:MAG TPA: O-antigen ligase family protein [Candidatus Binataceae bacterium]|nr:O-antigen ligase family protein [Candidatus Binataceae bacterium]